MFTTIIALFLTVFGALRATPLYSGILTLGNGLDLGSWFHGAVVVPLLSDNTTAASTGVLASNGTRALVLRIPRVLCLPPPPLVLTLPPGHSDRALAFLTHTGLSTTGNARHLDCLADALVVISIIFVYTACLWLVRVHRTAKTTNCDECVEDFPILVLGKTYDGDVYEPAEQLVGVPTSCTLENSATVVTTTATNPEPTVASKHITIPTRITTSNTTTQEHITTPSIATNENISTVKNITNPTPDIAASWEDDDNSEEVEWKIWTNKRRRRTRRPRGLEEDLSSSRSPSIASSSYMSNSLFSASSSTSTTATSLASSRRSSFAKSSPYKLPPSSLLLSHIRTPPRTRTCMPPIPTYSIASHNRFTVLEVEE
ncbi:hypothetical protein BD413DRAFT_251265 [Trametes elegans]|nr:hypothetical protein BD413DRAFT_251265 [Trametes elegans]